MKQLEGVGVHLALTLCLESIAEIAFTLYFNCAPTWPPPPPPRKCQELIKQEGVKKKKKGGPRLWQQKHEFRVGRFLEKKRSSRLQIGSVGSLRARRLQSVDSPFPCQTWTFASLNPNTVTGINPSKRRYGRKEEACSFRNVLRPLPPNSLRHDGSISVRLGRQPSSTMIHHLLKNGRAKSFLFLTLSPISVGLSRLPLWEFVFFFGFLSSLW